MIGMPSFRGYPACSCLVAWLVAYERELLRRGVIKKNLDVYQLIGNAKASGDVHSKGGAYDIGQTSTEAVQVAREMGAAAWHRTPKQGFMDHHHGVLVGCPHLVANGRGQIADLARGMNGLVGRHRAKDDGPAPRSNLRTWEQGISWAAAQGKPQEESEMTKPHTATISDKRINESSALAASARFPGFGYTVNDEVGPVYLINLDTGAVVNWFQVANLDDTEALAVRADGTLIIGALGDNSANRHDRSLTFLKEPDKSTRTAVGETYRIAYPDGPQNVEALAVHPLTQNRYLASKAKSGNLYRSDVGTLQLGKVNTLKKVGSGLPAYISDMTFTASASHVLIVQKGVHDKVVVLDGSTWRKVGEIPTRHTIQGESITLALDGLGFYHGSEGAKSPIHYEPLEEKYR